MRQVHPAACKLAAGQGEHHATCSSPQHKRIKGPIPIKQARQSNERKLYRCNDQSSILYVQAWKKEKEHQSRAAKSCSAALSLSSTPPAAVPLFELEHTHHLSLSMVGIRVHLTGGNRSGFRSGPVRFRFGPVPNRPKFKI